MKRVILKISGEAIKGKSSIYNSLTVFRIAKEIIDIKKYGYQIGVVLGGGNILRGSQAKELGIMSVYADNIGMLATVQNAIVFSEVLITLGCRAKLFTSVQMDKIAPIYTRKDADIALRDGYICFFAGGIGNPFFSTDTATVMRAVELDASLILKGTKVDGLFSCDPIKNSDAKFIESIKYDEVLSKRLRVMDMTAFSLARENNINIRTFNMRKSGNIKKALIDETIGSLIHN